MINPFAINPCVTTNAETGYERDIFPPSIKYVGGDQICLHSSVYKNYKNCHPESKKNGTDYYEKMRESLGSGCSTSAGNSTRLPCTPPVGGSSPACIYPFPDLSTVLPTRHTWGSCMVYIGGDQICLNSSVYKNIKNCGII